MVTEDPPRDRDAPALELERVVKSFGPVVALRSGTLALRPNSIHALIGENGAGKSTLVKIMAGLYRRDAGDSRFRGESVDFTSTAQSKDGDSRYERTLGMKQLSSEAIRTTAGRGD